MNVVIAGGRDFNDYELLTSFTDKILEPLWEKGLIVILSGHCRGADRLGERYAAEHDLAVELFLPDWSIGRSAGPRRNKEMLEEADLVIAFPTGGRGTQNLLKLAKKNRIRVEICPAAETDNETDTEKRQA